MPKVINFSRAWPIPVLVNMEQDYSETFRAEPYLQSFVAKPRHSPVTEQWVLPIPRKITNADGEFLGVIVGVMELRYFEKLFRSIMPEEGSSASLHLNDGTIVARHPRIESVIGHSFPASLNALSNRTHGTIRVFGVMEGKDRILAAQRFAHFPLYATVGVDVSNALANWQRGATAMVGAALAIGSVIGVVVLLCV